MGIYSMIEKKRREEKRKQNAKIAKAAGITAVLGAAVGAASGLLFAPKSGKETRADISEKTVQAKEKLSVKSAELKENLNNRMADTKTDIKTAKNKISDYLAEKKSKMTSCESAEEVQEETTTESELSETTTEETVE